MTGGGVPGAAAPRTRAGRRPARLLPVPAPGWMRVAVEFRHPSWHDDGVLALLERHGAAYCVMSGADLPCVLRATAPFVYVRLHGPDTGHLYAGSYCDDDLRWWADRVGEWAGSGRDVFVYFNNDGTATPCATPCGCASSPERDSVQQPGPRLGRQGRADGGVDRRCEGPVDGAALEDGVDHLGHDRRVDGEHQGSAGREEPHRPLADVDVADRLGVADVVGDDHPVEPQPAAQQPGENGRRERARRAGSICA